VKLRYGLVAFAAILMGGCVDPNLQTQLYPGPKLSDAEVAQYHPWNYTNGLTHFQIYTITLDGHNYEDDGGIGNVPASGRPTSVLPGNHTARISFVESTHVLPGMNTASVYSGWYEITFEAKRGMVYAPIFNLDNPEAQQVTQMCIAEASQEQVAKVGMDATRKHPHYVACAKPSIDPDSDKASRCLTWKSGPVAGSLKGGCKHNLTGGAANQQ